MDKESFLEPTKTWHSVWKVLAQTRLWEAKWRLNLVNVVDVLTTWNNFSFSNRYKFFNICKFSRSRRLTFYNVQVPGKRVEKVQGILKCGSEPQPKLISQWKLSKLYLWSFQIHYTSQRGIKVISFRLLCISCTFCNIISENLHWERTLCKMDSRIYQITFFFQPT